jgi:protein arginine kinase activator
VKCQFCSNPATVHLTNIENNQKKEMHLCQSCAESHQLIKQHELNLPAILKTLIGQHVGPLTDELSRLACPACGVRFMEFRAAGRLGCPHDYQVFRAGLEGQAELVELRRRLRAAVEAEAYEEAACIRDILRQKESHG